MTKIIKLYKTADVQMGGLRITQELSDKIQAIATEHNVSQQVVVRSILENFINEATFETVTVSKN